MRSRTSRNTGERIVIRPYEKGRRPTAEGRKQKAVGSKQQHARRVGTDSSNVRHHNFVPMKTILRSVSPPACGSLLLLLGALVVIHLCAFKLRAQTADPSKAQ